jgi:hypothetical protein
MPQARFVLIVFLMASLSPAYARAEMTRQGRVIPLNEDSVNRVFEITTHPSLPTTITFPEPFVGAPACGDCIALPASAEVLARSEALFGYQLFRDGHYLVIKAAQFSAEEGGTVPSRNYLTSINIRLASTQTLTLIIRYGPLERADVRVTFTLPLPSEQNSYIRDQLAQREAALEQQFDARVEEVAMQTILRAFAEPHECIPLSGRKWHEQVHLELRELCRFGLRIFLTFTVENRGRVPIHFGEVHLSKLSKERPTLVAAPLLYPNPRQIAFQEILTAVVSFTLSSQEEASAKYELLFRETGGKGREVMLRGFGF